MAKDRALLHNADRRIRRHLMAIGGVAAAIAIGLVLLAVVGWAPQEEVKRDVYKLGLQFFLITAGGGVLLAIVGNIRDRAAARQARAASVQQLDRELDRAYRAFKKTRRQLRASLAQTRARTAASIGKPWLAQRIPRAVFEKAMDEFLQAQLELETICNHIGQRDDILTESQLGRMRRPLRYASRYFHDVYEDFQHARIRLNSEHYSLANAQNVNDFLRGSEKTERPQAIREWLCCFERAPRFEDRSRALEEIVTASQWTAEKEADWGPSERRYADVANACLDLLSAELAAARLKLLT